MLFKGTEDVVTAMRNGNIRNGRRMLQRNSIKTQSLRAMRDSFVANSCNSVDSKLNKFWNVGIGWVTQGLTSPFLQRFFSANKSVIWGAETGLSSHSHLTLPPQGTHYAITHLTFASSIDHRILRLGAVK